MAQGRASWPGSKVLQLGDVPVQIQGLGVREGFVVLHGFPSDDLLHGHFHFLAVEGVLPGEGRKQIGRAFRPEGERSPSALTSGHVQAETTIVTWGDQRERFSVGDRERVP